MDIIFSLISLFIYFLVGGYVSQRYKSMVDLGMVVLWPAYLAGKLGQQIYGIQCHRQSRKRKLSAR